MVTQTASVNMLQESSKRNNYLLRFDGACSPNPGIGWVLFENEKAIAHESKQVGFGTNNVAEYLALIDGLRSIINKYRTAVLDISFARTTKVLYMSKIIRNLLRVARCLNILKKRF